MMRPLPRVWTSASVAAAAHEIRDSGLPAVGVTEGFFYVAVVTQTSLAAALAAGIHPDDTVTQAYDKSAVTLPPYAPGEKALEIFASGDVTAIPIVDDYGHLMGVLTPADLYPKRDKAPRPQTVGGMATPFGVYLTTGTIGAGAQGWPLVVTGMVMSLMFTTIFEITTRADYALLLRHIRVPDEIFALAQFLLFLVAFRLLPLAGIHAAEHKVVHAIERGEDLTKENVRRMPRVHPRCGTNLVVGLSLLIGIAGWPRLASIPQLSDLGTRMLIAIIATFFLWKPLGSLAQYWGTTKEPTDRQLEMGIKSGEELLKNYATGRGGQYNVPSRLFNSGIFHVMAGASMVTGVLYLLNWAFHWHLVTLSFT